ncbi:MAG: CHRD domain-containing protein [Armatimonadetes bacterium]|nr:CHRD domain-containing protein [Anaerolineae bacterium]
MRSTKFNIAVLMSIFVVILAVGLSISLVAQESTPESPMGDSDMMGMMMQDGSCPDGLASIILERMSAMMEMEATDEAMMEATDEAMMEATDEAMMEATDEAMMEATDDAMMMMTSHCLYAELNGANEVPGPGDEDGYGVALVEINSETGELCYDVAVANITLPAAAMHIHIGDASVSGDVVVPFDTAPDADGLASGCMTDMDMTQSQAIVDDPAGFYVNVHTSDFPDGAVRGQLSSLYDMMMMNADVMRDMMEMTAEATPAG